MLYRQNNMFLRYDVAPVSSYIYSYEPSNERQLAGFRANGYLRLCISHNHIALEVIRVLRGEIKVVLNDESFIMHKDDVIFMNPFDIHTVIAEKKELSSAYHVINFNLSMLRSKEHTELNRYINDIEQSKLKFRTLIPKGSAGSAEIVEVMSDIHKSYEARETSSGIMRVLSGLLLLMSIMNDKGLSYVFDDRKLSKQAQFSKNVVQHVSSFYALPLTTEQVAKALHYNKSYFCRTFKSIFSMTFSDYLNQYRITVAKSLSLSDHHSINDIAMAVGYVNYNVFSNHFKSIVGISPREYYK